MEQQHDSSHAKTILEDADSVEAALKKAFAETSHTTFQVSNLERRAAQITSKRTTMDQTLSRAGWSVNNNQTALGGIIAFQLCKTKTAKRRYLISSPPGTGKSRMVASIAYFIHEFDTSKQFKVIKYVFSHSGLMNVDEDVIKDLNSLLSGSLRIE